MRSDNSSELNSSDLNHREPVIRCERLDLHHVSPVELFALNDDSERDIIDQSLPYSNPHRVLQDGSHSPVAWRAPQAREDLSTNKWFIRWMVFRETGEIIGSLSFHGAPDTDGMLEIGLGVHENFQRRGFGTESLLGMWTWACAQPGVKKFRYTVDPHNIASVELIRRLRFHHLGQQIDEIDGPEDIYEMSAEEFRQLYLR